MFAQKHLNVKEVLAAGSGKLTIKLPKVLNKMTGKMTNTPFLFSGAHWTRATKSFTKSLSKKPVGYIEMTIQMACACTALNDATDTSQGSFDEESDDDERAMLCKSLSFMFHLTDIHDLRICLFVVSARFPLSYIRQTLAVTMGYHLQVVLPSFLICCHSICSCMPPVFPMLLSHFSY
jgi:hypothetical protein